MEGGPTTDNISKRIEQEEYRSLRHFLRTLERSENRAGRLVSEAIASELTARQAEMVRLYFLEQRSMREIAGELSVNPSTVSRTLSVARAKLRRCMRFGALRLLEEEEEY